jgi:hypothetical protein
MCCLRRYFEAEGAWNCLAILFIGGSYWHLMYSAIAHRLQLGCYKWRHLNCHNSPVTLHPFTSCTCVQWLQVTGGQEVLTVRFAYLRHLPNKKADVWHSYVFDSSFPFVLNKLKYLHGNVYKERPVQVHYGLDISSHCTSSLYTTSNATTNSVDAPSYLLVFNK